MVGIKLVAKGAVTEANTKLLMAARSDRELAKLL
jgi:hypothetical protein